MIMIGPGTPRCAGENFGCTWEHLGALARSLAALTTSLGMLATNLGAPRITIDQYAKIIIGNAACEPENHCYYLSFNDCENSCSQMVFSSMHLCINVSIYQYSYPSMHNISGLVVGGA